MKLEEILQHPIVRIFGLRRIEVLDKDDKLLFAKDLDIAPEKPVKQYGQTQQHQGHNRRC